MLIKAKEKARGKDKTELEQWLKARKFNKQKKVKAITALYDKLGVPQLTEKKIQFYFDKGFEKLENIHDSQAKAQLIGFTQDLINRQV